MNLKPSRRSAIAAMLSLLSAVPLRARPERSSQGGRRRRSLRGAVPPRLGARRADPPCGRQARREVGAGRDRRQQARRQRRDRHERDPRSAGRRLHLRLRAGLGHFRRTEHDQGRDLRLQPRLRAGHARGRRALHARRAGELALQDAGRVHRRRARQAAGHRGGRQRARHRAAPGFGAARAAIGRAVPRGALPRRRAGDAGHAGRPDADDGRDLQRGRGQRAGRAHARAGQHGGPRRGGPGCSRSRARPCPVRWRMAGSR